MESLGDHISLFNLVDVLAFIVIAFGMLLGARRGLSGELAGMVSSMIGFILGVVFFGPVVEWMTEHSRLGTQSARMVSFIVVFLIVFAIMLVVRLILKLLLKFAIEKKSDRWGGALAGMVKSLVVVLAVFLIMIMSPGESLRRMFGKESMIGSLLLRAIPELEDEATTRLGSDSGVMELLDGE